MPDPLRIDRADKPEQAFEQAFLAYKDAIFRHCYFHVFHRERARELMQEAFMKTWEYIADGHDIDNVRAFLYRVATNLIYNESRRKPMASLDELKEEGFDPGDDDPALLRDSVQESQVMAILKTVEEPYRQALTLRYVEGFTPNEIADITGDSPNAISVRINRGLKQLRAKLPYG